MKQPVSHLLPPMDFDSILSVIEEAGQAVLKIQRSGDLDLRYKSPSQPLTKGDLEADRILAGLTSLVEGSVYFSEERASSEERSRHPLIWIADPIDGTIEYMNQIPEFAVSVALVHLGRPIFGAVYNPFDSLEAAAFGKPLTRNLADGSVKGAKTICVSRSEWSAKLFEPFYNSMNLQPVGSIAYKLSLVAQGRYQGVVSLKPKSDWDIIGGAALLHSRRMTLTDLFGRMPLWNQKAPICGLIAGSVPWVRSSLATKPFQNYYIKPS